MATTEYRITDLDGATIITHDATVAEPWARAGYDVTARTSQ